MQRGGKPVSFARKSAGGILDGAEVSRHDDRVVPKRGRHTAQLALAAGDQSDPGAGRIEPAHDSRPDPPPGAGDDRHTTSQVDAPHVPFLQGRSVRARPRALMYGARGWAVKGAWRAWQQRQYPSAEFLH